MKTVTDESIERALNFLRDSSEPHAQARASAKYYEQKRKTIKGVGFLEATGSNIAEREAKAYTAPDYLQCLEDYKEAVYQAELLTNQREAALCRIDVWRTSNANQRKGHL